MSQSVRLVLPGCGHCVLTVAQCGSTLDSLLMLTQAASMQAGIKPSPAAEPKGRLPLQCWPKSLQLQLPAVRVPSSGCRVGLQQDNCTPDEYTARSGAKVWWYNKFRGHFQTRICHRTLPKRRIGALQVSAASGIPCMASCWPLCITGNT